MRRREFLSVLGGAAAAWPLAAYAQQQRTLPVIGLLSAVQPHDVQRLAFQQGLREVGFVEGHNVTIEYRSADGQYARLEAFAADLVKLRVDVIAALFTPLPARVAKAATSSIPIVFVYGGDPVEDGLVASLNRPGANLTGVTFLTGPLASKRLELLRDVVSKADVIGVLMNPTSPLAESQLMDLKSAAQSLGQHILVRNASNDGDFDTAFAAFVQQGAGAVLIGSDSFYFNRRDRLIALAAHHKLPAIYSVREYAGAGGLMTYGASLRDSTRQAGLYTGRILKGAKPNELPVMQPTKFELVINLKTAKTLGLTIPPRLLSTADEVIE